MIITRENMTVYPAAWTYNNCLIINKLAALVTANGGKVKPLHDFYLVNRGLMEAEKEAKKRLESYKMARENPGIISEKLEAAIKETEKKLERYQAIDNSPRLVKQSTYISFTINGYYYYFQFDDNPFFEILYRKIPVNNNTYSKDYYLEEFQRGILSQDCYLLSGCTEEEIDRAAVYIYATLLNSPASRKARKDYRRVKVKNTYSKGFHYEYRENYTPERIAEIDW